MNNLQQTDLQHNSFGSYQISIEQVLRISWDKTKGAKATIWGAFAIYILCLVFLEGIKEIGIQATAIIYNVAVSQVKKHPSIGIQIYNFIVLIIDTLLMSGIWYMGIRRAINLPISASMAFKIFQLRLALKVIGTKILYYILTALPLIMMGIMSGVIRVVSVPLLIIGGLLSIWLMTRLSMMIMLVLAEQVSPWQAAKISFNATNGNFWQLFGIGITSILCIIAGILTLGIGLIWILPFVFILFGVVYQQLFNIPTSAT